MCYSFAVEFNAARPGRRKLSISPAGSGLVLFRTTPPPSIQSPMPEPCLDSGTNKRSMEQTALAAEPGCAADSNSDELGSKYRPDQRALSTSFRLTQPPRKGWPLLGWNSQPHPRTALAWTLHGRRGGAGREKNAGATGCGKAARWKSHKTDFPTSLGNPAKPAGFPLSHSPDCCWLTMKPDMSCA